MSDLLTGLPAIDDAKARRLGETMRAVQARLNAPAPAKPVAEKDLRAALKAYCQAWADLRSRAKVEIALYNFDIGRDMGFDRTRLKALEQQIERLEQALGDALPAAERRHWA